MDWTQVLDYLAKLTDASGPEIGYIDFDVMDNDRAIVSWFPEDGTSGWTVELAVTPI